MRNLVAWLLLLSLVLAALPSEATSSLTANLAGAADRTQTAFDDGRAAAAEANQLDDAPAAPLPANEPCDDGCLCPYCPTYSLTPPVEALLARRVSFAPLQWPSGYVVDARRCDFVDRVFHPPRRQG